MNTETEIIDPERIAKEIEAKVRRAGAIVAQPKAGANPADDRSLKLAEAGFPSRAINALPEMTGPALAKAREKLPLILRDGMLLLIGPTGRGKTVMATWWAAERLAKGRPCGKFVTAYQLFARMKQCWTRGEDSEAILKAWKSSRFLVIDEMQVRTESAWENSVLDELINARYAAELPTVMLGNIEPGREQAELGARIVDRVRECGGIVNCNWGSYRK